MPSRPILLRRKFLTRSAQAASLFAVSPLFAAAPFWDKKQPAEWTSDEKDVLITNSPWAHKVSLDFGSARAQNMDSSGSRGSFGGMRGADSNGISESGGRGGRGGGGSAPPANRALEVTVRWDSAQPVLNATGWSLPTEFANSYAVSVTNLPPQVLMIGVANRGAEQPVADPATRQKASIERLLAGTSLSIKGQERVPAKIVVQSTDRASLIFGFEKAALPLSLDDKEVLFAMDLGVVKMHAKFAPKRMIFHGQFSV